MSRKEKVYIKCLYHEPCCDIGCSECCMACLGSDCAQSYDYCDEYKQQYDEVKTNDSGEVIERIVSDSCRYANSIRKVLCKYVNVFEYPADGDTLRIRADNHYIQINAIEDLFVDFGKGEFCLIENFEEK